MQAKALVKSLGADKVIPVGNMAKGNDRSECVERLG